MHAVSNVNINSLQSDFSSLSSFVIAATLQVLTDVRYAPFKNMLVVTYASIPC